MDSSAVLLIAFLFGAAIGSFLNVCIYRLPLGQSLLRPASNCPRCHAYIRPFDNVPMLSYLLLRGRCRDCGAWISPRYPLVELTAALLATATVEHFGVRPEALLYFAFAAALVVVTFVDIDHQIIPDAISLPGIAVGLTASFIVEGAPRPIDAAFGVILGGGILYLVALAYQRLRREEGMGLGDVKLLAMIGAFLGWQGVPTCLLIGSFSGSVVGLTVVLVLRKDRKFPIPFGPFLSAGALISLFFGDSLMAWYFNFFR